MPRMLMLQPKRQRRRRVPIGPVREINDNDRTGARALKNDDDDDSERSGKRHATTPAVASLGTGVTAAPPHTREAVIDVLGQYSRDNQGLLYCAGEHPTV